VSQKFSSPGFMTVKAKHLGPCPKKFGRRKKRRGQERPRGGKTGAIKVSRNRREKHKPPAWKAKSTSACARGKRARNPQLRSSKDRLPQHKRGNKKRLKEA